MTAEELKALRYFWNLRVEVFGGPTDPYDLPYTEHFEEIKKPFVQLFPHYDGKDHEIWAALRDMKTPK